MHTAFVIAQSILFAGIGLFVLRNQSLGALIMAVAFTISAYQIAINAGLPAWRDRPIGDAYDVAVLVWLAFCMAKGDI